MPKDKIEIIFERGIDFAYQKSEVMKNIIPDKAPAVWGLTKLVMRIKKIVFLISIAALLYPITGSLKRAYFLWDPQYYRKRLIRSGILFFLLSVLILPINLSGYGANYARMTLSPFEMSFGWSYRRLLMPAIAHFLGFEGHFLYHTFSLLVVFLLIYLVIAYFEYESVKPNLLDLLSIMTSSFVIFNFMAQGFVDPLMFITFLIAIMASDSYESRLAIVALSLVVHEATAFILVPLIVCFFPKEDVYLCLMVIAIYFVLFLLSLTINLGGFINTHIIVQFDKTAFGWMKEYPLRLFGGWLASYKLLWVVILYGILKMLRSNDLRKALCALSIGVISPLAMNLVTFDVSRHVGWGALALLICYTYLLKRGYAHKPLLRLVMNANILIPSIYVGTNAGFRSNAVGLYPWLYDVLGLRTLLGGL